MNTLNRKTYITIFNRHKSLHFKNNKTKLRLTFYDKLHLLLGVAHNVGDLAGDDVTVEVVWDAGERQGLALFPLQELVVPVPPAKQNVLGLKKKKNASLPVTQPSFFLGANPKLFLNFL